ncbi:MAG: hypothetical protein R3B40_24505 [Polyangiales bacterium]
MVETKYVDRHFLDDFVEFYSRAFEPPPPHCSRFHFFAEPSDPEGFERLLDRAPSSEADRVHVQRELQSRYLGFVVRRPLPKRPMGRTVLRTYSGDPDRLYTVVRAYRAHLLGMELRVDGLAYQQQDGGAAVCASTALWSAFQRVAYMSGERTPTPAAVTRAARSPFPASHGLADGDMARAIDALGYTAERLKPGDNSPLFRAQVASFLRSGHPVVLLLGAPASSGSGVGHAVTLTGYRESVPARVDVGASQLWVRGAAAEVVYVHDDNLGSHAHFEFQADPSTSDLNLLRGRSTGPQTNWWTPDVWRVDGALVPKPNKVRMPIEQLYALKAMLSKWVQETLELAGEEAPPPIVMDGYFASGIDVQRSVVGNPYRPDDARHWQRHHTLPRHVAVIEVSDMQGLSLAAFVFDATTLAHHQRGALALLCPAIDPGSTLGATMRMLGQHFEITPAFGAAAAP